MMSLMQTPANFSVKPTQAVAELLVCHPSNSEVHKTEELPELGSSATKNSEVDGQVMQTHRLNLHRDRLLPRMVRLVKTVEASGSLTRSASSSGYGSAGSVLEM